MIVSFPGHKSPRTSPFILAQLFLFRLSDMNHVFSEDSSVSTSLVYLVIFFTIDESKLFKDNKKNTKTCLDGNLHTEIRFDVVLV